MEILHKFGNIHGVQATYSTAVQHRTKTEPITRRLQASFAQSGTILKLTVTAAYRRLRGWNCFCSAGLIILVYLCLVPRFPRADVREFGFTPEYLNIAATSSHTRTFARTLSSGVVVPETKREPIYPLSLILIDKQVGPFQSLVISLQGLAIGLSLLIWLYGTRPRVHKAQMWAFIALAVLATVPSFYAAVLYPYAFQLLFVSVMLISLARAVDTKVMKWYGLSGLAGGLASLERGAYLLLPVTLFFALWLLRKRFGIFPYHLLLFVATSCLLPVPYLVRNVPLGATGINQCLGYNLGFAYGDLPTPRRDALTVRYDSYVNSLGTDLGTLRFIEAEAQARNSTPAAADRLVAHIVFKKLIANPPGVALRVALNVAKYPSHLTNVDLCKFLPGKVNPFGRFTGGVFRACTVSEYYSYFVATNIPTLLDIIVCGLSLIGLYDGIRRQHTLALLCAIAFVYTLLFSTLFVKFDPRYRGALDFIHFFYCSEGAAAMLPYIRRRFS